MTQPQDDTSSASLPAKSTAKAPAKSSTKSSARSATKTTAKSASRGTAKKPAEPAGSATPAAESTGPAKPAAESTGPAKPAAESTGPAKPAAESTKPTDAPAKPAAKPAAAARPVAEPAATAAARPAAPAKRAAATATIPADTPAAAAPPAKTATATATKPETTPVPAAPAANGTDSVTVVTRFLDAIGRLDADAAASLLADDVVYQNVSLPAARGRAAVAKQLGMFAKYFTAFQAVNHRIVGDGDTVLTERTDIIEIRRFRAEFWVCGTFEVRDGKIVLWRDYFDWGNLLAGSAAGAGRALVGLVRGLRGR